MLRVARMYTCAHVLRVARAYRLHVRMCAYVQYSQVVNSNVKFSWGALPPRLPIWQTPRGAAAKWWCMGGERPKQVLHISPQLDCKAGTLPWNVTYLVTL